MLQCLYASMFFSIMLLEALNASMLLYFNASINSASMLLLEALNNALEAAYFVLKGGQYCF
jgi:hypothetical protein